MRKLAMGAVLVLGAACGADDKPIVAPEPVSPTTTAPGLTTTSTEAPTTTVEVTTTTEPEPVHVHEPVATTRYIPPVATTRYLREQATTVPAPARSSSGVPPKYISDCESGGNPRAVNPNGHYGKWQFSQSTWESVGGTGRPDYASEAEQDKRAAILWDGGNGASHWECA